MCSKLEETKQELEHQPLVIAYDNGGGQSGTRKNPAYEAYNQLMRTYTSTLREYRDIVGNQPTHQPELVKFDKFAKTMRKVASD